MQQKEAMHNLSEPGKEVVCVFESNSKYVNYGHILEHQCLINQTISSEAKDTKEKLTTNLKEFWKLVCYATTHTS